MNCLFISLLVSSQLSGTPVPVLNPWVGPLPDNLAIAAQATVMTKPLINKLQLNEAEYIRLRMLHKRWLVGVEDIRQQTSSPLLQKVEISGLESRFEQECLRVLKPSQVSELRLEAPHDVMPVEPTDNQGGLG